MVVGVDDIPYERLSHVHSKKWGAQGLVLREGKYIFYLRILYT